VLVTGFEPFGGDAVNESWEAVRGLAARWDRSAELVTARLPVTFAGAGAELARHLDAHEPAVVVCTGLAAGTRAVRLERVAVNVADARIPDNLGARPVDEPVVDGGPVGYLSTLTYVCNATFYALAHSLTGRARASCTCRGPTSCRSRSPRGRSRSWSARRSTTRQGGSRSRCSRPAPSTDIAVVTSVHRCRWPGLP
jgi:pyrrolidone-carboxylate peptidase